MSRDLNLLNPYVKSLAEKLIAECKKQGITIIVTQTLRTIAEQNALYAQGRTAPGPRVTNAKGGYSIHNYGYAFDVCVIKNGKEIWDDSAYVPVGKIGESIGLEWGGNWRSLKDYPHFQYTEGLTTQDFIDGKRPKVSKSIGPMKAIVDDFVVTLPSISNLQALLNKVYGENLKTDNNVGPNMLAALAKHIIKKGDKGSLVIWIQKRMVQKGFKIDVSGVHDAQTIGKLTDIQKAAGLKTDGVVEINTWKELLK